MIRVFALALILAAVVDRFMRVDREMWPAWFAR